MLYFDAIQIRYAISPKQDANVALGCEHPGETPYIGDDRHILNNIKNRTLGIPQFNSNVRRSSSFRI